MAKIHALDFDVTGICRVVLHTPIPSGNNIVGNSWKAIWVAAGRNITALAEGTGIGQITTAEKASVIAGDVIEIASEVPIDIVKQGAAAVNTFVDFIIAAEKAKYVTQYNYYGWTNG